MICKKVIACFLTSSTLAKFFVFSASLSSEVKTLDDSKINFSICGKVLTILFCIAAKPAKQPLLTGNGV